MPHDVSPEVLRRLLDLQEQDTAILRLTQRRENLPEARRLGEVNDQLAELTNDVEIATKQHQEVGRELDRLEGEIGLLDQKITKEEQRMYSGNVSNPKELSSLQDEVAMLKKRKGALEDELLEVMVQKDQATETLERLKQEKETTERASEELTASVTALTAEIETELGTHEGARTGVVGTIPAEVLSLYDTLREQKGGVGAAALRDGTCDGCHTKLPPMEVERVKREGGLQRCDNCRRILVVV